MTANIKLFISGAFVLIAQIACGQVFINGGTIISITQGTIFYTTGDFTNDGQVQNDGTLTVSGAWTNAGVYQAEDGLVTFDGTKTQVVNHNDQSFSKLVISGGGEKIFQANILIDKELSLQSGLLATKNHSKIILGTNAIVTGGSASSFVQGPVYTTGTGEKFFPVGTDSTYLPVTFSEVSGTDPVIGVEAIQPNPNTSHDQSLVSVSALRYWTVTTASGTFGGSPVSIALHDETFPKGENVVVAETKSLTDPFESLGRSGSTGTLQSGTVVSEKAFTASIIAAAEKNDNSIVVYNLVTPNNDNIYDYLNIVNIESFPGNGISIVNRWGDKVFEMDGYANTDPKKRFNGDGNVSGLGSLSDGTYFYVIDKRNGEKKISGFFLLKR